MDQTERKGGADLIMVSALAGKLSRGAAWLCAVRAVCAVSQARCAGKHACLAAASAVTSFALPLADVG